MFKVVLTIEIMLMYKIMLEFKTMLMFKVMLTFSESCSCLRLCQFCGHVFAYAVQRQPLSSWSKEVGVRRVQHARWRS